MLDPGRYYMELAAAFARGRLGLAVDVHAPEALEAAVSEGLRLHKFKRNTELPRVRRVLGALRGLAPTSLLDVGSGRAPSCGRFSTPSPISL